MWPLMRPRGSRLLLAKGSTGETVRLRAISYPVASCWGLVLLLWQQTNRLGKLPKRESLWDSFLPRFGSKLRGVCLYSGGTFCLASGI